MAELSKTVEGNVYDIAKKIEDKLNDGWGFISWMSSGGKILALFKKTVV